MSNNPKIISETEYGVYVWKDANGKYVADSDYNYMCIASKRGDARKIDALRQAAESFGVIGGSPEFREGSRPISHEEWEVQVERMANGEVPDEYDLGNLISEYKYQQAIERGEIRG